MRKSLVCVGSILIGVLWGTQGRAFEYLAEPESRRTPVFITLDSVRLSLIPQGWNSGPPPFWVLGS